MRSRSLHPIASAVALAAALASFTPAPVRALSWSGNANSQANGGVSNNVLIPGPESTTGTVSTVGGCSTGTGQSWLSVSTGGLALALNASGAGSLPCIANSYASGNSAFSETYSVVSSTLPAGTPVDLSLCVRAALHHSIGFTCANLINDGVTSVAGLDVAFLANGGPSAQLHGNYSERWNCFDGHQVTETGLLATGGVPQSLDLLAVPVGGLVTVSATMTGATGAQSFQHGVGGGLEMAVVLGYSSMSPVQLLALTDNAELSPASNCTETHLASLLPPAYPLLDARPLGSADGVMLRSPAPNPARTGTTLEFALPADGDVRLGVFDVAGARIATLVSGVQRAGWHRVEWNGRGDRGEVVAPGLYWVKLVTPAGRAVRSVAWRP